MLCFGIEVVASSKYEFVSMRKRGGSVRRLLAE